MLRGWVYRCRKVSIPETVLWIAGHVKLAVVGPPRHRLGHERCATGHRPFLAAS